MKQEILPQASKQASKQALWQTVALSASIGAVLSTSVVAMEQPDKSRENQDQQQNPPQPPINTEKSPIENTHKDAWDLITNNIGPQEGGRLKQTSKTMNEKVEKSGERAFNTYNNKKDSLTHEDREKSHHALHKAENMGNEGAWEIIAQELYEKLKYEQDEDIKLTLCKDLAENGLFLLLNEWKQQNFIQTLYEDLVDWNRKGALPIFLSLSKDILKMTEKGQNAFIDILYNLADKDIEGALKALLDLSKYFPKMVEGGQVTFITVLYLLIESDKESALPIFLSLSKYFPEMTEEGQERFIMFLSYVVKKDDKDARQAFLDLREEKDSMKEKARQSYEEKLNELNSLQENLDN